MKRGIYLIWDLPAAHAAAWILYGAGTGLALRRAGHAKGARQRPVAQCAHRSLPCSGRPALR